MIQYFPIVTGSLTVLGNINVSGSITTSGSITISGSITSASFASTASYWSGSITNASSASFASTASFVANAESASNAVAAQTASFVANAQTASYVLNAVSSSFASTASFVALAQSASNAVSAVTASFANNLTVAGTLTAQTLVVQTITSSVDFVTGSTRFGSILGNTHVFSGSVTMNPGGLFVSSSNKVGIGTTNPDNSYQGLTIFGTDPSLRLKTSNASGWTWIEFVNSSGTNNFSMGVNQTTPFFGIKAGAGMDSPNFAINSSGNVGIGTTTIYSGAKLHILGGILAVEPTNGNTNSEILIGRGLSSLGTSAGSGITAKINFAFEGSNDNFYQEAGFVTTTANQTRINSAADFYISTKAAGASSPTEKFRITSAGKVGIGNSAPNNFVDIYGNGSNTVGIFGVRTSGGGTFITGRIVSAETSNQTQTIATCSTGGTNERIFLKIQVVNVSAVADTGNCHVGYALWSKNGTKTTTTMTLDSGNSNVSNTNVGSLSWSGNDLQYTTNRNGNYEMNHITILACARDTGVVS